MSPSDPSSPSGKATSVESGRAGAILLLLPGLLCDRAVWAAQCADLAPLARCVVPAYGLLDSIEAMARHVLATAPAQTFALAGHSMGGRVALEVLRQAPDRVERLALLDTGFQPLPAGEAAERERSQRHQWLDMARKHGMRAMGEAWAAGMVHPARRDNRLQGEVFEQILAMIGRSTPEVFAAQIAALLGRPDATPVLATIRCPTLVLCGRQDAWSPLDRHVQMAEIIRGARLAVIEESGHMAPMERPAGVSAHLAQWLKATAG